MNDHKQETEDLGSAKKTFNISVSGGKKTLDIDFIVCADIYKYCCLYWCSSEKAISAHIVKDYYDLPLIPFHSGLKALENTASLRKGMEDKEVCSTHTPLLKSSSSE